MKKGKLQCHLKLIFCFTMMCFIQFTVGCLYTFSSTLLAQLREPSSTIHLSIEEESWITSITILICPIGLLIIGIITDKFGRRKAIQIISVPMALGWLTITFSNSYATLLIGKIILGIPFGVSTCTFLYISELSPTNLRPLYITLVPFTVGLGMMAECILAMYCRWQTISGIMLVVSVVNFLTLFMVPEPPIWLRARGRAAEADEVDRWLDLGNMTHASDASADVVEQSAVATAVHDNMHATPAEPTSLSSSPYWSLFLRRNVWLPTVITLTFFVCQQCSGVYVLLFYSMDVVRDCKMPWDSNTVSLFLSLARVIGVLGFAAMHRVARRTLVVVSGGCMAISLLTVVAYMRAFAGVQDPPFEMTLIVAFVMFMFFALLGILPMPWVLCGEVFPMEVKGVMNGVVQTCGYVIWFMICKIYPSLILNLGVEIIWSIFAFFCILNVLFAIFIMPETKGKSLDEILLYFESQEKINKIDFP
ncbi:facilitated trehalose transporter Tret1-like [Metopolophium dirhodum]|uniref:facilitated trehalose transporter Tret1-like n=1 Tax=Metopolophium dirhodum TaxID=44670 RepID=UPI00298FA041|nr:facilitated trehalose transporter Tret1-like [Metopolophium dirhodum]XP_060859338.1 facilitated trehalose transporter Tret1-like [Metopolophium dirhodum]